MAKVFNTKGIREFCVLLNKWDRYSDYSDDVSVRRRGDAQWTELQCWEETDERFTKVKEIWIKYVDGDRTIERKASATKEIYTLL